MAITTWISLDERKQLVKVSDKDVNELYQEVRSIKPTIYLQESPYRVGNIFNRKWIHVYTIYHTLDDIDAQVINLFGLGGPYSKEVVMGFLIGCLTKP